MGALRAASYLLVAALVVGPGALSSATRTAGLGADLPGTLWMYGWIRRCVETLSSPARTDLLFYPEGKDLFLDTGANFLDAVLTVPFQWALGTPGYLDWFACAVLVGNAVFFERFARAMSGSDAAAWAGAVAWEVSPYGIQELKEGRPTQAMLWFVPLVAGALWRLGGRRDAMLLGLGTLAQGLTYWFMTYFIAAGLWAVALRAVAGDKARARWLALGVAVCLLGASPFVVAIAKAAANGEIRRLALADSWWESPGYDGFRWRYLLGAFRSVAWPGVLVLALSRPRQAWPWLLGLATCVLWAVGLRVQVGDVAVTNWPEVWAWEHIPMVKRLGFPERAMSVGWFCLCAAAVLGLARRDAAWAVLAAGVVVGETAWRRQVPIEASAFAEREDSAIIAQDPGPVIALPLGVNEDAMVQQLFHGAPLFGGMGERAPDMRAPTFDARLKNSFAGMLGGTTGLEEPRLAYTRADREEIVALFRWVTFDARWSPNGAVGIAYAGTGKATRLGEELGAARWSDGGLYLWDLRSVPTDAPGLADEGDPRTAGQVRVLLDGLLGAGTGGGG
jgi:hypothetical protein